MVFRLPENEFLTQKIENVFFHSCPQSKLKVHITTPRLILDLDRFFFFFAVLNLKNFNIAWRLRGFHPQFAQYLIK